MTIKQTFVKQPYDVQKTGSTDYYDGLGKRFDQQRQQRIPRSAGAWAAEQNRLGSWSGGVGVQRSAMSGTPFNNGRGNPSIDMDPDEAEGRNRIA